MVRALSATNSACDEAVKANDQGLYTRRLVKKSIRNLRGVNVLFDAPVFVRRAGADPAQPEGQPTTLVGRRQRLKNRRTKPQRRSRSGGAQAPVTQGKTAVRLRMVPLVRIATTFVCRASSSPLSTAQRRMSRGHLFDSASATKVSIRTGW